MDIQALDAALRQLAPIHGVIIGDPENRATWRVDFEEEATAPQRAAAEALLASFEPEALLANLEPDQFWFGLRLGGYEDDVRDWVARLNDPGSQESPNPNYDPVLWASVSAKLEFAKHFERGHPLVLAAAAAIGLSDMELDALWQFAAS
jgi:hypothetical protein